MIERTTYSPEVRERAVKLILEQELLHALDGDFITGAEDRLYVGDTAQVGMAS